MKDELCYVSTKYRTAPEMNLSIDEQNIYIHCTIKDILNYSPWLNPSLDDTKTILKKYENDGDMENIRCLVLRLKKNSPSQRMREGDIIQ